MKRLRNPLLVVCCNLATNDWIAKGYAAFQHTSNKLLGDQWNRYNILGAVVPEYRLLSATVYLIAHQCTLIQSFSLGL